MFGLDDLDVFDVLYVLDDLDVLDVLGVLDVLDRAKVCSEKISLIESNCRDALCCYPNVKVEFRDSGQICTTAPIFLKSNYFRQNIWKSPAAQFHFSFIFGYELNRVNCSYKIYKKINCFRLDVNKIVGTS